MRTVLAQKVLGIARRILEAARAGRQFHAEVIEWAEFIVRINAKARA